MAESTKSIDYAEWYKRVLVTLITLMVGGILSIGTDMKGDLKLALYKSEDNKVNHSALVTVVRKLGGSYHETKEDVAENHKAIEENKRAICIIQEIVQ